MRVCLLTPELPPFRVGGIGTYVATLADELGRRGYTVDVVGCDIHPGRPVLRHGWGRSISLCPFGGDLQVTVGRAVEGTVRWLARRGVPGAWRALPYAAARAVAAAALAVRRFVRSRGHRYDVIEYPNWPGHGAWLPPPGRRGRYVNRLSTSGADAGGGEVGLRLERRGVRRAALVLAHSAAMARKGEELYGLPPGAVTVVPLGLPDGPVADPPIGGRLELVTVGRAEDRKGTDLLLSALAAILPEYPGAAFRFVGPGLPEYLRSNPAARAAWGRLTALCPDRVADLGRVSDADRERVVGRSHWALVPSRFESFGLVAAEAMRAGTPVVYAACGGLAEVGGACPANVPVAPGDADDLARALGAVCRAGPGAAREARGAARRAFEGAFAAGRMAERTIEAYRSVLEGRA